MMWLFVFSLYLGLANILIKTRFVKKKKLTFSVNFSMCKLKI